MRSPLRTQGWLAALAAVPFLCAFSLMIHVRHDYAQRMPSAPDPATGRTERVEVGGGKQAFVTPREKRFVEGLHLLVLPSALLTLLFAAFAVAHRKRIAGAKGPRA